jgi:hypothetical protein
MLKNCQRLSLLGYGGVYLEALPMLKQAGWEMTSERQVAKSRRKELSPGYTKQDSAQARWIAPLLNTRKRDRIAAD